MSSLMAVDMIPSFRARALGSMNRTALWSSVGFAENFVLSTT